MIVWHRFDSPTFIPKSHSVFEVCNIGFIVFVVQSVDVGVAPVALAAIVATLIAPHHSPLVFRVIVTVRLLAAVKLVLPHSFFAVADW